MRISALQQKLFTNKSIAGINALLREFRSNFGPPSIRQWRHILAQKDVRVFIARDGKQIVGMAILRWHKLPIGTVGAVEDVVVNSLYRGMGYGEGLTKLIIKFARKKRMAYIDLTSRPSRVAANRLYQKFGWKKRKTNVYRLSL